MTRINSWNSYLQSNPSWENDFGVYQRDSSTYKRLVFKLNENFQVVDHGEIYLHEYHATINVKTGEC